jgi:hypothetical protein
MKENLLSGDESSGTYYIIDEIKKTSRNIHHAIPHTYQDGVKWLHLYMFQEKGLVEAAIERALNTGGFSAIILSCDHPHQRVQVRWVLGFFHCTNWIFNIVFCIHYTCYSVADFFNAIDALFDLLFVGPFSNDLLWYTQNRMMPYFRSATFPYSDLDEPFFPNQAIVGYDKVTLRQLGDPKAMAEYGGSPGGSNSFTLSWDDVKWIQSVVSKHMASTSTTTKIPIVAKGILSADDARKAIEVGVDAIVVSNHGGRQCDIAVSAIEAVPAVVAAVQGKIPIFVDSGVRTSGDIVRAICLGATGVLLGRPPLWALACDGSDGLERMFEVLKADLKDDMRSLGVTSLSQLSMDLLWPPDRERIKNIVTVCQWPV